VGAISSGKVAGAALDVFETEPYSGPLLGLPQVVVTPHLAGSTAEAQDRAGVVIAEQVAAALDGDVVRTAVNIPVVDPRELEILGPFVPLAANSAASRWRLRAHGPPASRLPSTARSRSTTRDS
jgi:D-3-phosphoglycerate dehydrogenase